jgi:hypothetical protein
MPRILIDSIFASASQFLMSRVTIAVGVDGFVAHRKARANLSTANIRAVAGSQAFDGRGTAARAATSNIDVLIQQQRPEPRKT